MSCFDLKGSVLSNIYDSTGTIISKVYDLKGALIRNNTITREVFFDGTWTDGNWNSFAKYGDYVVQIHANDYCCLFDLKNKTKLGEKAYIKCGHGESSFFGNEKYNENDFLPLMYSADYYLDPQIVYVNRIVFENSTLSTQLVKKYAFPSSLCGYWGSCSFDNENNVIYLVSYKRDTFRDGTDNALIVSKWDMNDATKNEDGTYTPGFIESFTIPYVFCTQASYFYDNKIWIGSGIGGNGEYLNCIDLSAKSFSDRITLENQQDEVEGVCLYKDTEGKDVILYTQTDLSNGIRFYTLENYFD